MRLHTELLQHGHFPICFHYAATTTSADGERVDDHCIDFVKCVVASSFTSYISDQLIHANKSLEGSVTNHWLVQVKGRQQQVNEWRVFLHASLADSRESILTTSL